MAENYGGDKCGGYGDNKRQRLGLMKTTVAKMAMWRLLLCSIGIDPFIKVVQVDQTPRLARHTTIHTSGMVIWKVIFCFVSSSAPPT